MHPDQFCSIVIGNCNAREFPMHMASALLDWFLAIKVGGFLDPIPGPVFTVSNFCLKFQFWCRHDRPNPFSNQIDLLLNARNRIPYNILYCSVHT